jgi:phage terminase small subunit
MGLPMRRPGRPSATFPAIDSSWRPLLQPPPELSASQRELFATITATTKIDHFRESDAVLIGLYCQALELAQSTGADVARDPAKASAPLLKSYELATRRVLGLSQRLRLSPQARSPNVSGRSADGGRQASYYDRVNAGGGQFPGWEDADQ